MKWQLRLGNGKVVLSSMLISCLWACMVPAAARAQAVFGNPTCTYTVIKTKPSTFQISGTAQVTGLNPQSASTTVTFTFQTRPNADGQWTDLGAQVEQTTNGVNGTANFSSGGQATGPAGQGVQYRVLVSGYYLDGNGKKVTINAVGSTPITPNP